MITNEVVNQGIDYILSHLNEPLTVELVAQHCHFSKFYYSRIFKMETGETVYGFIKRAKMERSAILLKSYPDTTITTIGQRYGYDSANFSTAFKKHLQISPYEYRQNHHQWRPGNPFSGKPVVYKSFQDYNKLISIQTMEDQKVIYQRHIGSYQSLAKLWQAFMVKYDQVINEKTLFIERSYDDPSITDISQCICDICLSVNGPTEEPVTTIKGGKFAVYHFVGRTEEIYEAYQGIFNIWLPNSDYRLEERTGFDIYRFVDNKQQVFTMDFYIPIQ